MKEKRNNAGNVVFTQYHPSCRLCHYSGFSNNFDLIQTGKCPYVVFKKDVGRNK